MSESKKSIDWECVKQSFIVSQQIVMPVAWRLHPSVCHNHQHQMYFSGPQNLSVSRDFPFISRDSAVHNSVQIFLLRFSAALLDLLRSLFESQFAMMCLFEVLRCAGSKISIAACILIVLDAVGCDATRKITLTTGDGFPRFVTQFIYESSVRSTGKWCTLTVLTLQLDVRWWK